MKKYLSIPVLLLIAVCCVVLIKPQVSAQDFNFDRAYNDLVFNLDVYEKARSNYLLQRARYLQSDTLTSQTEARDATVEFLEARTDAVISYIRALRVRMDEIPSLSENTKNEIATRLDDEVEWYLDFKTRIRSAGTLNELVQDSDESADRFFEFTEPLAYEFLIIAPINRVEALRTQYGDLLGRAKIKTDLIREAGDHDVSDVERWTFDTEEKFIRSGEKLEQAKVAFFGVQAGSFGDSRALLSSLNNAVLATRESIQFLKETGDFMREMTMAMRTK